MAEAYTVVSLAEIQDALLDGVDNSREMRRIYRRFVEGTARMWEIVWEASGPMTKEGHHAYETGDYVAHIKKQMPRRYQRIKKFLAEGIPIGAVYNDSRVAEFVEEGTGYDRPGTHSPWGRYTPTPRFQIAERTAKIADEMDFG